jgi:oligopeptide/dipeptide ABC transporter ATP-binding protein
MLLAGMQKVMKKNNGRAGFTPRVKMQNCSKNLLEVEGLKTYFPIRKGLLRRTVGYVKAVDGVSFGIRAGQTLGLVGESGCGKTTIARSIVRLAPVVSGRVIFGQADVLSADRDELRRVRSQIGLIFQDPYSSLNPRMTVGSIVGEPLKVHRKVTGAGSGLGGDEFAALRRNGKERVVELLSKVGLSGEHIKRYPHEFSGGQRQRIGIARALALEPKLVICDEPVSSLDVSIQAQILNLLKDLQEEFGLTYLFIAHDLAVVEFFCDVVAVMYMGKIVERAEKAELYRNPLHPYTRALMSAIPRTNGSTGSPSRAESRDCPVKVVCALNSGQESLYHRQLVRGCGFSPRCSLAAGECLKQAPMLEEKAEGHFVACWKCL